MWKARVNCGSFLQLTVDSLFLFFHTTTAASAFVEELS